MVIHIDVILSRVALVKGSRREVASALDLLVVVVMAVLGQESVLMVDPAKVSVLSLVLVVVWLEAL